MSTAATENGANFAERPRNYEVSRVEALSDAVLGFAITLIVVSLDVPRTYAELMTVMRGLPVFAICFALLLQIWYHHYRFFRRYGLQDGTTIALNSTLLFVVLFYVYPLKFLFNEAFGIRAADARPLSTAWPKCAGRTRSTVLDSAPCSCCSQRCMGTPCAARLGLS